MNGWNDCIICKDFLYKPRTFTCGHSICLICQQSQNKICCPFKCTDNFKVIKNFQLEQIVNKLDQINFNRRHLEYEEKQRKNICEEINKSAKYFNVTDDMKIFAFRYVYWIVQRNALISKLCEFFETGDKIFNTFIVLNIKEKQKMYNKEKQKIIIYKNTLFVFQ